MGHLKFSETRAERTPAEWLPVGAKIGSIVNSWAGRSDIVAYVGPGAGGQAPACFNPYQAEVEVNVDIAFGKGIDPSMIGDLSQRNTLFDWPRATGAIFHEALHARYSRFDLAKAAEELSKNEHHALSVLEESRIEAMGVKYVPANRVFLRACALEIVLADIESNAEAHVNNGVRSIAGLAALTLARVDAGSLDNDDVAEVRAIVLDFLGSDVLNKLQDIWLRFQAHELHSDPRPLYELAREWEKVLAELAEERGEDEGSSSGSGVVAVKITPDMLKEIVEALEEAASIVAIDVGDDVSGQQQSEEWKETVDQRTKAARQQKEHGDVADEVFNKSTGEMGSSRSNSKVNQVRNASGPERAAAVKIAQMLERAKYRERDESEITSVTPPGRLRSRAVVQNAAYKAQGSMMQAEPWRRTKRRHTDDPTLTIGVMVDISGSMSDAMEPMAVTAWAMSEAARRVQARCAMVYYGQAVFPTLKPGQHLDQVTVYSAPDATEKFDKAFKALDGSLSLLHGTGARLLVVVSDGCYTPEEYAKAKNWLKECDKNGVAVLWLPYSKSYQLSYSQELVKGTNAVLLSDVTSPTDAAVQIGTAAANALSKIGRANAA